MKKTTLILFISVIFIGSLAASLLTGEGHTTHKGADILKLDSGKMAAVPFPHHLHQAKLKECNVCHDKFPKARGAIKDLQAKGKIKKQEVMNQKCIACHKERKMADQSFGPLSCADCHKK